MLNDRFNNNSKGDLKDKFRDKKFVSAVAIGIFVLILFIVLIAKGCSSKKKVQKPKPAAAQVAPVAPAPAPDYNGPENSGQNEVAPESENDAQIMQLKQDGKNYFNGWGGKTRDYAKAKECFNKAKELGAKDVDPWIKICDSKLNKNKAKTKPIKKAPKKRK